MVQKVSTCVLWAFPVHPPPSNVYAQTNCTECVLGYDPASNCITCLSNMGSNCSVAMGTTEETETIDSTEVIAMYMETLDSIGEVYSTRVS